MKRFSLQISPLILVLTLSACAPAGKSSSTNLLGSTGYTSPEGFDYVTNGDDRVQRAVEETETAAPAKPLAPGQKALREQLKEFEITRFHKGETQPSRFGEERLNLKFIFRGGKATVEFKTPLAGAKPHFTVKADSQGYSVEGELNDSENQTRGEFTLTEKSTGQTARAFYWAYRAKLTVRQNRQQTIAPGSAFEKQIADLRENTFGWVHNWNVVRGASFFIVDIVKVAPQEGGPSLLAFKGPSLRTGEASHNLDELAGTPSKIELVGNGEQSAGRMFQVSVQDPQTKESNEFMLDVELDQQATAGVQQPTQAQPQPGDAPAAQNIPDAVAENPEEMSLIDLPADNTPASTPAAPTAPAPEPAPTTAPLPPPRPKLPSALPAARPSEPEPAAPGRSYLRVNSTLPRSSKMITDFNRNRNLPGVKQWMENYRGSRRADLQKFYTYANPFRRIMEKVGQLLDVSPVYAYVTVIESPYFVGGQYKIAKASGSSALGPFQIVDNTAQSLGLRIGGSADERRYFVPSACGAAKYFRNLVNIFDDSDSTVAILAYNQGQGGAAMAVYCSFASNTGDRKTCAQGIGRGGNPYGKYLDWVKKYNYSYAEMDRLAAIPKAMRDYVNKKLAIYFISNDFAKHGFELSGAPTQLPGNIMPSRPLQDAECARVAAGAL